MMKSFPFRKNCTSPLFPESFVTGNMYEVKFSFLTKLTLMFYNCVLINYISGFSMAFCKDHFVSFVSAWYARCCETEMVHFRDG